MNRPIFSALAAVLILCSCSRNISYQTDPKTIHDPRLDVSASLSANPSDNTASVTLELKNRTSLPVNANCIMAVLQTVETFSCNPDEIVPADPVIPAGKSVRYILTFKPINSSILNRRLGVSGDLRKDYFLNLNFIGFGDGTTMKTNLHFRLDKQAYTDYENRFGIEKFMTFADIAEKPATFVSNEKAYFIRTFAAKGNPHPVEPYILLSSDQFILDTVYIKADGYSIRSNFYVRLNFINKSSDYLMVNLTNILVQVSGSNYKPVPVEQITRMSNEREQSKDTNVIMMEQNGRFAIDLKYPVREIPKEFRLFLNGITTTDGRKYFYDGLLYSNTGNFKPEN
jgi:hypothetical protein